MKIWLSLHIEEEQLESIVECLIEELGMSEEQIYIDDEDQPLNEECIEKTE